MLRESGSASMNRLDNYLLKVLLVQLISSILTAPPLLYV